jgi:plasmid replication initiation protein
MYGIFLLYIVNDKSMINVQMIRGVHQMNEVTRYHNELNTVPMRKWTAEEQNFFFAVITQARGKGTKLIKFDKQDLVMFANYDLEHVERFKNTMSKLEEKVFNLTYTEKTSVSSKRMVLFQSFYYNWEESYLEVKVSEYFDLIINKIEAEFTQFELIQFTSIRSNYAKEMFKKLKQWRTIGKKEYPIEEFKNMLQIPKSYKPSEITRRVIVPIETELSNYFQDFKITPIKARSKGNPITAYCFTWMPEETNSWVTDKYKPKPKRKTKKEKLPEWAENQTPAQQKKDYNENEFDNIQDRIANLKSSQSKGAGQDAK